MAHKKQKPVSPDPPAATGSSIPSRPGVIPTTSLSSTSTHPRGSSKPLSLSLSHLGTATQELWNSYLDKTPNSLLMMDAFLVFLMYIGGVQFVYACLTGGYPFNSFLAGFTAAVGQFVLTGLNPLTDCSLLS
jgi:oligosaccharyltransferase complex subunit epsilon